MIPAATANTPGHYSHRAAQPERGGKVPPGSVSQDATPFLSPRKWHRACVFEDDGSVSVLTRHGVVRMDYDTAISGDGWQLRVRRGSVYFRKDTKKKQQSRTVARVALGDSNAPVIDHINGNPLDNRRVNLRECSFSENARNTAKNPRRNCSSRFKGVRLHKGRWRADICADRRRHFLGYFDTEEQAALAYDEAARELFGRFCALNFPREGEQSAHRETLCVMFPDVVHGSLHTPWGRRHNDAHPAPVLYSSPVAGGLAGSFHNEGNS